MSELQIMFSRTAERQLEAAYVRAKISDSVPTATQIAVALDAFEARCRADWRHGRNLSFGKQFQDGTTTFILYVSKLFYLKYFLRLHTERGWFWRRLSRNYFSIPVPADQQC